LATNGAKPAKIYFGYISQSTFAPLRAAIFIMSTLLIVDKSTIFKPTFAHVFTISPAEI
jgi:hypothetical protein